MSFRPVVVRVGVYLLLRNEQNLHASLQAIGNAADVISETVRSLVELSSPIQMEQALQNNVGPYKNIQEHVFQSAKSFHPEQSFQPTQPGKEKLPEDSIITRDSNQWARQYLLTFGISAAYLNSGCIMAKSLLQTAEASEAFLAFLS